jgi:putative N-acetylmannosamine-6-phosphate epimerase
MSAIMNRIKDKLVVSCQAYPGDPLEDPETLRRIASAAVRGGAAGLRLNGAADIAAVRRDTGLPIIGINKKYWNDQLRITPDFASAMEVAHAGADIIALDCTNRAWPTGDRWQEIIARIHSELKLLVMADIATLAEALDAAAAGADMVGMTLNGYTEETSNSRGFSWPLLHDLVKQANRPVIAEGHISTPDEARRAIARGAWSVVVGSAITRPGVITAGFVQAMERPSPIGIRRRHRHRKHLYQVRAG